jgi:hypothetical protein
VELRSVEYLSEAACTALQARLDTAVISITEPGRAVGMRPGWGEVWRVQFADAEWDIAMIERLKARGQRFDPAQKGFPSEHSARAIFAILRGIELREDIVHVIVHCHAGRRRSAAVAKFIALRYGLPFDHSYEGYNETVFRLLTTTPDEAEREIAKSRVSFLGRLGALFARD